MRILIISAIWFLCSITNVAAQTTTDMEAYHRSSLYSIMLKHPEKEFCGEMVEVFRDIPIPDKYNNHDLGLKVLPAPILQKMTKEEIEGAYREAIEKTLVKGKVGGRLVAKWFNRDKETGAFDMNLVQQRGYYNASILDVREAMASQRGLDLLADAGEELIGHTYIIVNDIRYADEGTVKVFAQIGLTTASMVAEAFYGDITGLGEKLARLADNVVHFKVFVTSYLFRLDWNEDLANEFYTTCWMDTDNVSQERKQAFDRMMSKFKLNYIGCTTVFSGKTALGGVKSERDMFLKVCTRAVDQSICNLQKSFDEFKVFAPLVSVSPLHAYIGKKEGVDEDSRYEVLEQTIDEDGRTQYNRVGIIRPEKNMIWDNRFMAADDNEEGSNLGYTTFKKVSGGDFYPGMLIREIK